MGRKINLFFSPLNVKAGELIRNTMKCKKCNKEIVPVGDDICENYSLCPKCARGEELLMEKLEFEYQKEREYDDREVNPQDYDD